MKTIIQVSVCKTVEIDNYENGCDMDSMRDFGIVETFKSKGSSNNTIKELVRDITERYGKPCHFDDRLEVQRMENDLGQLANEREIEAWKKNEITLYAVSYSFYFSYVTTEDFKSGLLKDILPELEDLN